MEILKIKGMSCNHCVQAVSKALEDIEGIENVVVDLAKGEARFDMGKPVEPKIIEEHIKRAGYQVG